MVLGAIAGAVGGKLLGGIASKVGGSVLGKVAGGLMGKLSGLFGGGNKSAGGGSAAKDPAMGMLKDIKNLLQQTRKVAVATTACMGLKAMIACLVAMAMTG